MLEGMIQCRNRILSKHREVNHTVCCTVRVYSLISLFGLSFKIKETTPNRKSVCIPNVSVGMVKQPTAEQTEFQMSNEDFPALPGTQLNDLMSSSSAQQLNLGGIGVCSNVGNSMDGLDHSNGSRDMDKAHHHMTGDLQSDSSSAQDKAFKRGIQTSPDGKSYI